MLRPAMLMLSVMTLVLGGAAGPAHAEPTRTGPEADVVVVGQGDQEAFHLLIASDKDGYAWRTVASLSEPGVETDRWIGNVCVTGSGDRAVVVYAPRAWTNSPVLAERGGLTAVVDLHTGAVDKVPVRSSLAYFSPGCGAGEQAVITQSRGEDDSADGSAARTRLVTVDTTKGTTGKPVDVVGQITSAVPASGRIVAAAAGRLVAVHPDGRLDTLAKTASTPSRITPDQAGGVVYLDAAGERGEIRRVPVTSTPQRSMLLADGPLRSVDVRGGAHGSVQLTGSLTRRAALPPAVRVVDGTVPLATSSLGKVSVDVAPTVTEQLKTAPETTYTARVAGTDRTFQMTARPGERPSARIAEGSAPHPLSGLARTAGTAPRSLAVAAAGNDPVDADATCSIARNDPYTQVEQPTPRQVEWAADQAVVGNLTLTRDANWHQAHMSTSWSPQGLFPPLALSGGGRVPVQIFLGVMAQESNLWQASGHSLPGVPGNPLIGNYYGRDIYDKDASNDWDIDFAKADCGYGVTQITDGMRKAGHTRPNEVALSPTRQRAVAVDYATNIAAGLRILQDKWNQTRAAGIIHSNGDPQYLENWFFAVWAYNSGLHPQSEAAANNGAWGLGWLNNPVNPRYPVNRGFFGAAGADAANPGKWPYPEKVIGFAAYSIATADGPGFRAAWWTSNGNRDKAKPSIGTFCTMAGDHCDLAGQYTPNADDVKGEKAGPCSHINEFLQYDLKCWWHSAVTFNDCAGGACGHELLRFDSTYGEQPDGINSTPHCDKSGLPAGALVVDDVPASAAPIQTGQRPCGANFGPNAGSFAFTFAADSQGRYPSKVDTHQIGVGLGGHAWFTHTVAPYDLGGKLKVTGTWTFTNAYTGWARVLVHMPDVGAQTQQAAYTIGLGGGRVKTRYALQNTQHNEWKSLGVMQFAGTPTIALSNETWDGTGDDDIAWDAVAIQPLTAKPADFVVALGDSYTAGEGASDENNPDYYREANVDEGHVRNKCHRSKQSWPRKSVLADNTGESLGTRADRFDNTLDFQFHACSIAETFNLNPRHSNDDGQPIQNALGKWSGGQWGEVSQIDKGYLDENTTLVMLSIGGNDARFKDVILECLALAGLKACQDAHLSGESDPLSVSVPRSVNGPVKDSITQTLREIRKRAPNAKIMLMGYPKLFENNGQCVIGIGTDEAPWLNQMSTDIVAPMMKGVADGLRAGGFPVYFADPTIYFAGQAICGSPETIHGIRSDVNESFHPKLAGTTHYADAANATLRQMGL
ncbi:hypothetical protein GCM10010172_35020 [Paractinoplanes ferrugineus]|uniref:GDSL-like lipase/acylhydrolase family protein n=1 Tax=Paractinoplanes ferrugineus TaxID=113564 RepID=A0A919J7W9_9ACTN|nr:GDSL-type esterase/lipase family protein [Actinoplanes ferrugineus]GIE15425.1 hypothetical protein Afe05nite_72650 [Actinoplanes ferrugineus]